MSIDISRQVSDTAVATTGISHRSSEQVEGLMKPGVDVSQLNGMETKSVGLELNKVTQTQQVGKEEAINRDNVSSKQLEKVAQQLQEFVGEMNRGLEFLVDKDSGRDVIKVIDKNTGDLVKQFPSEEVLDLVAKLSEATGNFFDSKV